MVALDAKGRDPNNVIMLEMRENGYAGIGGKYIERLYVGQGGSLSTNGMIVEVEIIMTNVQSGSISTNTMLVEVEISMMLKSEVCRSMVCW